MKNLFPFDDLGYVALQLIYSRKIFLLPIYLCCWIPNLSSRVQKQKTFCHWWPHWVEEPTHNCPVVQFPFAKRIVSFLPYVHLPIHILELSSSAEIEARRLRPYYVFCSIQQDNRNIQCRIQFFEDRLETWGNDEVQRTWVHHFYTKPLENMLGWKQGIWRATLPSQCGSNTMWKSQQFWDFTTKSSKNRAWIDEHDEKQ